MLKIDNRGKGSGNILQNLPFNRSQNLIIFLNTAHDYLIRVEYLPSQWLIVYCGEVYRRVGSERCGGAGALRVEVRDGAEQSLTNLMRSEDGYKRGNRYGYLQ